MLLDKPGQKPSVRQHGVLIGSLLRFIVLTIIVSPSAAWSARPVIAEAAPDFALKTATGDNLRLSEYRGDIVLLNFWSTRCGRCRNQLSKLDALYSAHREQGFQLLSINIDREQDSAREVVASLRLQFPVMFDEQKFVSRLYDLGSIPFTVLIDPTGTVRYMHTDYKRGDEHMYASQLELLLAE